MSDITSVLYLVRPKSYPHPCVKDGWQLLGSFVAACRSREAWGEAEPDPGPRGGRRLVGLKQGEHPLPPLVPAVPADGRRQQQLQQLPRQVLHRHCSSGKAMFVSEKFPHLAAYPAHLPSCPVCRLTPCLALADVA